MYDPQEFGAKCDRCFLQSRRVGGPVPPELNPGAQALVIAEAPGEHEVDELRPLVGPSGIELMRALSAVGVARSSLSYENAAICRPPGNEMKRLLHELAKENKQRVAEGKEPYLSPFDACRPRLLHTLRKYQDVITVGQAGLRAITQGEDSVMARRGGPIEGVLTDDGQFWRLESAVGHKLRILPTLHPAFVLRARRWTKAFRADLAKAWRWFRGTLGWKVPMVSYNPPLEALSRFLAQDAPFIAFDYETDGLEPLSANVRCISLATVDVAYVVAFLSIDGESRFYTTADEEELKRELAQWMAAKERLKVGHNAGYYDRIVARRQLGVDPKPLLDTILLHRAVESELPHTLGYVGSVYTDVTSWKADDTATTARTDFELWSYAATDAVVTARVVEPLQQAAELRGQMAVAYFDHKVQAACVGMHTNGMLVDQRARAEWDAKLRREAIELRTKLRELAGNDKLNPNSVPQIKELLFEKWELPVKDYTDLGEPSTGDDSIRKLMVDKSVGERQRAFLDALRRFRRKVKYRGTYVRKLVPATEIIVDDDLSLDEDELARLEEARRQGDQKALAAERRKTKRGVLLADGRVHANYNAHGTTSGRLSSSDPNMQNLPRRLRNMFVAAPGNVLVACDLDQVELRIAAALAGARNYLDAFANGKDPHTMSALLVATPATLQLYERAVRQYGEKGVKKDPDWARVRDFQKRAQYGVLYGAELQTLHNSLTEAEDDNDNLIYANLDVRETRRWRERWLEANPEFEQWWESEVLLYRQQGFLADCLLGRRRDFLDGEDRNEILNYRCQSTAAAFAMRAMVQLTIGYGAPLQFEKWGPGTGLIQQGHDSVVFEVPEEKAKWAAGIIQEAMTGYIPGLPVKLTSEAKIGKVWSAV